MRSDLPRESGEEGASSLAIVFMLAGLILPMLAAFMTLSTSRSGQISADFTKLVARETAKSSFMVLEAALKRRLWEMPPESDCLKNTAFGVSGTTPDGATYRVDATFDPATRTLRMVSKAQYRGASATFEKKSKILDASDFLVFSKGSAPTYVFRGYDAKAPAGFVGRNRKVYFEGPVQFISYLSRAPNPGGWMAPTPMQIPEELGTILQGERLYFLGGLMYSPTSLPLPDVSYPLERAMLAPYASGGANRLAQNGAGAAVITADYTLARQLESAVRSGSAAGLPPFSSLKRNIYPIAFTCGTPPLNPQTAPDSGCYMNDPNRWLVPYYSYGPGGTWGYRGDITCLADNNEPSATRKYCSSSNQFPNGFRAWRSNAGLDTLLYGNDGSPLSYPPINWDNLDALKEDAVACGYVIPGALATYEDCDVSNQRIVNDHLAGVNSCERIARLDLESLPGNLQNFRVADFSDPAKKDRLLRRVVYANQPTELAQVSATGIVTSLADPIVRANLSLWLVNEDRFVIKPHQPDLSSPLNSSPATRRKLYFNLNAGGGLASLNLLLMTPEQVQIIAPQHVPYTYAEMVLALPVVGGKLKPKNHIYTDAFHQENDGFAYGMREVNLGNLVLITNAVNGFQSSGFTLRGLWASFDSSSSQFVRNACMFSDPVSHPAIDPFAASQPVSAFSWVPAAAAPDSVVPPSGSKFYAGGTATPAYLYPQVFNVQTQAMAAVGVTAQQSLLNQTGIRILMNFDGTVPSGRRNLASPRYLPTDAFAADLTDRRYYWANPAFFYTSSGSLSCVPPMMLPPASVPDIYASMILLNRGDFLFIQNPPATSVNNLGSLFGVELPFVEAAQ